MSTNFTGEASTEVAVQQNTPTQLTSPQKHQNWLLLLLYCTFATLGGVGGPLLQRLYFTHGGSLKWFQSGLPSIGFFIFFPPLVVQYFKTKLPTKLYFIDFKLFYWGACIGILLGLSNYLASVGLSRLPLSTMSLLSSTLLGFTALFSLILVKQKFTFYSSNAVVAITLGAVVLALHSGSDRPSGVTKSKYLVGFFLTITGSALGGLCAPLYQLAFTKSSRPITYLIILQVMVVVNITSALFAVVGMLTNKEFQAIPKEANVFSLGKEIYILIAIASAIIGQLSFVGIAGIIACTSSLFAGIYSSTLVPITQVASVITFHEKFTGEKALSLALCLWGFASYFFGEFKMSKKLENTLENGITDSKKDLECPNQIELSGSGDKKVQDAGGP